MKKRNRMLAFLLSLVLLLAVVPGMELTASAATDSSGIQKRLDEIVTELKSKFSNGVFTANGQQYHDETQYGNCSLYGIVKAKYPSLSSSIASKSSNGWDCAAFAKLMTVLLCGTCKDTNDS